MRVRLRDVFQDFDKLRSGYMTSAQFRRCVSSALDKGVVSPLTESEYSILTKHYFNAEKGGVNWVKFTESIDKVFGPSHLEKTPTQYIPTPNEVVKPERPRSPKSEVIFKEIISRLKSYVKHHGSDVKDWFEDFDAHNNGYITLSQFRRGIPQNILSESEQDIILNEYNDNTTNYVNYFKLNADVNRKVRRNRTTDNSILTNVEPNRENTEFFPVGTEELLLSYTYNPDLSNVKLVENKLKKYVYRNRIRLIDFFSDYDRHKCGLISKAQFQAGLKMLIEDSKISLVGLEVNALLSVYENGDGRVLYRKFCSSIDSGRMRILIEKLIFTFSVFTIDNLEYNPTAEVSLPARDFLIQGSKKLSPTEEARCKEILSRFKTKVSERRPLLTPYFYDFDTVLSTGKMGCISKSHFSRLLSTMKLDISENDLKILFKKYEDCNRINYLEFIHTIDPLTSNQIQEKQQTEEKDSLAVKPVLTFEQILTKLRYQSSTKRIRVAEYFKDFDKLRSYHVKKEEFIRGLNRIGLDFSQEELELVAEHYKSEEKKDLCKWKEFEKDIEIVFGETGLEAKPTVVPRKEVVQSTPFILESTLSENEEILLTKTINKMRDHLKLRKSSIKPFFKDFDKLYTGYVTKSQFRQCLTYAQCYVSEEEFDVLSKKWGTNETNSGKRVCYLLFLKELEGQEKSSPFIKSFENIDASNHEKKSVLEGDDVTKLLNKIKTKVKTQRIRVIDYMQDFDHLKHGKITKNKFKRALHVLLSNLNEVELNTLEKLYESKVDNQMVEYLKFSDEVESVFTVKGLDKTPTREPEVFKNYVYESGSEPLKPLSPKNEDKTLTKCLERLNEKVRQRRLDVLGFLEDYDFVNEGTITTNQFRSILGTVGLPVDDAEILSLSRRFGTTRNKDRINYRAFAETLTPSIDLDDGKTWTREIRKSVDAHSLW
ncbi:hypothetical protein HDU92_005792 [Lobulomyces angularis]|nr:hypothetical protein HDU92_005792 [Lobulomyces angularis]